MSLQMILGSSGSGKSYYVYKKIIQESIENPDTLYYVIVPEQFTMQTQKTLVEMHPGRGILNLDVLSFQRLAYRVLEEVGGEVRQVLEETGKSLVIQKMAQEKRKELSYLGGQMKKKGYVSEMKSLISELMQYDISVSRMEELAREEEGNQLLRYKLSDVAVLYQAFVDYLKERYLTGEEILDILCTAAPKSRKLKDCVMVLDGFTGFTPIQNKLIEKLLSICRKIYVTATLDERESTLWNGNYHRLFSMSQKMISTLYRMTEEREEEIRIDKTGHPYRFSRAKALDFLEQNLFRYGKRTYSREQKEIILYAANNPQQEIQETARRIRALVAEEGLRYGEIAVITGDLKEYASYARQVFEENEIPYFIDEKHSVLMNPFVEFIRAAMDLAVKDFSYESVFRYLRCGMSDLTREQVDRLENYVIALGIRGWSRWQEKWVRIYRGEDPQELEEINQFREAVTEELKPFMDGISQRGLKVRTYCEALYQWIVQREIQQKLKEQELLFQKSKKKALEKEYAQIYGIVMGLFDKMVEILGEERVSRKDFQGLLEAGLEETQVGIIPPSTDQVLVGDMERTRLKDVRALFFVGVNDGSIPKNEQTGGILTELDRESLKERGTELAPSPRERTAQQQFYLYLNLTKPSYRLHLSYSHANGKGEALSPAYLIASIRKLYPKLSIQETGNQQEPLEQIWHPRSSMEYFLKGLQNGRMGWSQPLWEELYSWYLSREGYEKTARSLVEAAYHTNPQDKISKSVARILYGEVSPYSATRLERFCACAFAHFLQYGLKVNERVEYQLRAMDMGNILHQALEKFARTLRREKLDWAELEEERCEEIARACMEEVAADYGNTVFHSSARNTYMIARATRLLIRTVWALKQQLKRGSFRPEGFEISLGGVRIDRVDVCEEEENVYVKVMDYKTGNTAFDLLAVYYGLQIQLLVYLDAAMEVEKKKFPGKEVIPAGIFYYNVKDPLVSASIHEAAEDVQKKLLKELRMNGLVAADPEIIRKMDATLESLPVAFNKDGSLKKGSSAATGRQFQQLSGYVKRKIKEIQNSILEGEAAAAPYELGKQRACTYCPYHSVCGFDERMEGYSYRRLKEFTEEEIWNLMKEDQE